MRGLQIGLLGLALVATVPVVAKTAAPFAAAITSSTRPAEDVARDADRKPGELMAFAGVKPGMTIVELAPGGGYFTRLLTLAIGPTGKLYPIAGKPSAGVAAWAAANPNVMPMAFKPGEPLVTGADMVWTTLNYHDFKNNVADGSDAAAKYNAAAFKALKPGGIYLIVDHQAAKGAGASVTNTLHRIEDKLVIAEVEKAGFKLEARSQLLRHPADDHTLKVQETGIRGKTDQFVLRFRKPKK